VNKNGPEGRLRTLPVDRQARSFDLVFDGKEYPPKYVLSLAFKHATDTELPPSSFSGGEQTNSILRDLGFEVVERQNQRLGHEGE
jgi:hypothetical protein